MPKCKVVEKLLMSVAVFLTELPYIAWQVAKEFCPRTHRRGRRHTPKLPLPLGVSGPSANTWFLGPTYIHTLNTIFIGSSVLAQLTHTQHITSATSHIFAPAHSGNPGKRAIKRVCVCVCVCVCCSFSAFTLLVGR